MSHIPPERIPPIRCPKCLGEIFDNRAKKASGEYKPNSPDARCKDRDGCGWIYWGEEKSTPAPKSRPSTTPTRLSAPDIPAPEGGYVGAWSRGVGMFQRAQDEAAKILGMKVCADRPDVWATVSLGILSAAIHAGAVPPATGHEPSHKAPPAPAKGTTGPPPAETEDDIEDRVERAALEDESVPF